MPLKIQVTNETRLFNELVQLHDAVTGLKEPGDMGKPDPDLEVIVAWYRQSGWPLLAMVLSDCSH